MSRLDKTAIVFLVATGVNDFLWYVGTVHVYVLTYVYISIMDWIEHDIMFLVLITHWRNEPTAFVTSFGH